MKTISEIFKEDGQRIEFFGIRLVFNKKINYEKKREIQRRVIELIKKSKFNVDDTVYFVGNMLTIYGKKGMTEYIVALKGLNLNKKN